MTAAAVATPTLRWSSVRACPRKAVYEATGAPARERSDREERILFRGRRLGRDYADWLAAKYGEHNIERERKVTWPLGVGHEDVFLRETRTVVEVLSSAHASEAMIDSKLLQAVGYVDHDPDADNGVLVILNPSDFTEERIILAPSSRRYAELRARMEDRIAQVLAWRDSGQMPPRVCAKPSEAFGHFCLHAEHCFEGWQPPPLEEVTASEELLVAVTEFEIVKRARKVLAAEDVTLERRQKDAQEVIEAAELPAGSVQVGPFKVTRTLVARKATFEWDRAETAGLFDPDPVADFFKPGASYSTYKAERVNHSGDEYGETPF